MEHRMSVSFQDHYNCTDEQRQPILSRIRSEIRESGKGVIEKATPGQRIAYSKPDGKVFLEVKIQRRAIVLHMTDVLDPDRVLSKIPESHGWGQLSRRVKIQTAADLERVLPLVRAAWLRG
jgi:predicted transport protein